MKCDICEREVKKTIPFYYGFFKSEYEPEKWIEACDECCRDFQRASFGYLYERTPLIEMERKIIKNVEKKKVRRR
nr:MAG TPA_asm: hypothetical protein [Caudoviricetes sp.]